MTGMERSGEIQAASESQPGSLGRKPLADLSDMDPERVYAAMDRARKTVVMRADDTVTMGASEWVALIWAIEPPTELAELRGPNDGGEYT